MKPVWIFPTRRSLFATTLLSAMAVLPACSKPSAEPPLPPPPVRVALAKIENVPIQLSNIGIIQPVASVTLQSQVDGLVEAVLVTPGEEVKKGQILFKLDSRPFTAALLQAQANLLKDQATAKNDQITADQQQKLLKMNASTNTEYLLAKYTSAAAAAQVKADAAAVQNAQIQVGYCTIKSPMDGKVGDLQAFAGSNTKATTTNLIVINQLQPIYVSFALPQRNLDQIRAARLKNPKLPVFVSIHGIAGPPHQGVLTFINNTVDDSTGTIQLMGTFANKTEALWPGEFVDATLEIGLQHHAVVIPIEALQTGQDGNYVFTVTNNIARTQPVIEAFSYNGLAVITKGLAAGQMVITDGQVRVIPGQAVEIVKKGLVAPITAKPSSAPLSPTPSAANIGHGTTHQVRRNRSDT